MAKNKVQGDAKELNKLIRALSGEYILRVGILGSEASSQAEGTDLTNAQLGAVHEFGANINHPGGTPYIINPDGSARFVAKDSLAAQHAAGETTPHEINIPARSFLAKPLTEKLKFDNQQMKKIKKALWKQVFKQHNPKKWLQDLGAYALAIIDEAFATGGFGEWVSLTAGTIRQKEKKGQSPQILRATGQLARSISFKVIKKQG